MKKNEIHVGGRYTARVSGNFVTVRVTQIRPAAGWDNRKTTVYDVENEKTKRRLVFHSAAKFRSVAGTIAIELGQSPEHPGTVRLAAALK